MTEIRETCIYHVCSRALATQALAEGSYRPPSLASEGFIHFSQAHQVHGVIAAYYAGLPDLALLVVDPKRLTAPLRFEAPAPLVSASSGGRSRPGGLFPHLYGPLNSNAIVEVVDARSFDAAAGQDAVGKAGGA